MTVMAVDRAKATVDVVRDMSESYADFLHLMKGTSTEANAARKLWRGGNHSKLVKLGLALIVFPEPTPVSETVGMCLLAAGAVQKGIRDRTLYTEDLYKTFHNTLKNIMTTKNSLRI